jgi:hypothetical protein
MNKIDYEGGTFRLCYQWDFYIPIVNKPINYLEIGGFYGHNLFSVETTYGQHPESKLYVIDPWIDYNDYNEYKNEQDKIYSIFNRNLFKCPGKNKITPIRGFSHEKIPDFPNDYFDIIYIDGNHNPEYIMEDAVLSFRKLKSGGILIFDDYNSNENDLNTKHGIDSFISSYRNKIDKNNVRLQDYQIFLTKL